jgi:hypothetical protein
MVSKIIAPYATNAAQVEIASYGYQLYTRTWVASCIELGIALSSIAHVRSPAHVFVLRAKYRCSTKLECTLWTTSNHQSHPATSAGFNPCIHVPVSIALTSAAHWVSFHRGTTGSPIPISGQQLNSFTWDYIFIICYYIRLKTSSARKHVMMLKQSTVHTVQIQECM